MCRCPAAGYSSRHETPQALNLFAVQVLVVSVGASLPDSRPAAVLQGGFSCWERWAQMARPADAEGRRLSSCRVAPPKEKQCRAIAEANARRRVRLLRCCDRRWQPGARSQRKRTTNRLNALTVLRARRTYRCNCRAMARSALLARVRSTRACSTGRWRSQGSFVAGLGSTALCNCAALAGAQL